MTYRLTLRGDSEERVPLFSIGIGGMRLAKTNPADIAFVNPRNRTKV
jgi:hypothetical protein